MFFNICERNGTFQNNRKTRFALIAKRLVTHRDSSRKFVSELKNMPSEKNCYIFDTIKLMFKNYKLLVT